MAQRIEYVSAGLVHRDWQVWGYYERQEPGAELNFPAQVPWYRTPDGWREHTERDALGGLSPTDLAVATEIGRSVLRLERTQPELATALRDCYRAIRGMIGDESIKHRAKIRGISRSYLYELRDAGKRWVEADLEYRLRLTMTLREWARQLG